MRFLLLAATFSSLAFAQEPETRTFRHQNVVTLQDFQELNLAATVMSGLKVQSADADRRELSIAGTPDQLRVAEWVLGELDRPRPSSLLPSSKVYTLQTKELENTMRVFYPAQISSVQDLNEVATAIRTITDMRYVTMFTSSRALALRGTAEQIEAAEWLLNELNETSPQRTFVFSKTGDTDNQLRIFRVPRTADPQQFNETQTMVRTLTNTRRVYPSVGRRAIILRGSDEQVELTKWILTQLNQDLPLSQKANSADFASKSGDIVRMFFLSGTTTPQAFLDTTTRWRTAANVRQAYHLPAGRVFAVRGSAAQIAQVAALASE